MNLGNTRQSAVDRVARDMNLRRPQVEALRAFHEVHRGLPNDLSGCSRGQVSLKFREIYPTWSFDGGCPEITFHLATGVGKTRLIGAVMAYLFLARDSSHFVIVTPRAEIVRKFLREARSSNDKYIFHDRTIVEDPEVVYADNIDNFEAAQHRLTQGPTIWIITPQALATPKSRLKAKTERGQSLVDYLKSLKDLVVFFDESHHLGSDRDEPSVWRREIRNLNPKYVFGTSASIDPKAHKNVIYSYDLKKCLNEHLYTKEVRIIPEKKDPSISDEDYDKMVLRFGLQQLQSKQNALDDYVLTNPYDTRGRETRPVKAVMLVCCEKKDHAEEVTAWLRQHLNDKESVLLVHSGLKEADYLPQLLKIDGKDSKIRVVVNVTMLSEGWDVSNVYVIAPLRKMASVTMVTQVMGRGLRLPFGDQVGQKEVDTLDVLCFGAETLQGICDKLILDGYGIDNDAGIQVIEAPKNKEAPITTYIPSIKYRLNHVKEPRSLSLPHLRLHRHLLELDEINLPGLETSAVHSFRIHDPRTVEVLKGKAAFTKAHFIDMIVTGLLKKCRYLSHGLHQASLGKLVERFLVVSGQTGPDVPMEPEMVIYHIKDALDVLNRSAKAIYERTEGEEKIDLTNIEIFVPGTFKKPLNSAQINRKSWSDLEAKGLPIAGWKRSVFEAVPFDQPNEVKIAKALDSSSRVGWWFRNLPQILRLSTPAGMYAPDFAMFIQTPKGKVLLEVKGDDFQLGATADANLKKDAAIRWCKAMTEASKETWAYWFLLDSDADLCETFEDIEKWSEKF